MNFDRVSRFVWSGVKTIKRNAPVIEAILGTAFVVGGATALILSAEEIAEVNRKVKEAAEEIKEIDKDAAGWSEMGETKAHYIFKTVKECSVGYAKSAGVGIGITGIGLIFNGMSTVEFTKQVEAATVAAAGIYTSFNQYRQRVVADQGSEKDFEYFTGCGIKRTVQLKKDGTTITTVSPIKDNESICYIPFSFSFTERSNPNWTASPDANLNLIYGCVAAINRRLDKRGFVEFNRMCEIFEARESLLGVSGGARRDWPDGTINHKVRVNPIGIQDMIDGISPDGLIILEYDDGTPLDFDIFSDLELIGLHLQ